MMIRRILAAGREAALCVALLGVLPSATAQLKPRPDAFPPASEQLGMKASEMALTTDEMASWDRYPSYDTYVEMMQQWSLRHPTLCRLDTIGWSVEGRLILGVGLSASWDNDTLPEVFYSSSIHGDELTGYVMMLRLIDTLLRGYGTDPVCTRLLQTTAIYVNPLSNPDGAYRIGNNSVAGAVRYNANLVDLNRNFPDPFATTTTDVQPENRAMMDYIGRHRFRLSANLHGGSEVLNYPWDSFRSAQREHPQRRWWMEVCQRFVDSCRAAEPGYMSDVATAGYIAGGDWYVINGGRQDYVNYYHNCLELTMEVSSLKRPPATQLPAFWQRLRSALLGYIDEVHALPSEPAQRDSVEVVHRVLAAPNPCSERVFLKGVASGESVVLTSEQGATVCSDQAVGHTCTIDVSHLPAGVYTAHWSGGHTKIVVVR